MNIRTVSSGIAMIADERERQISEKGFDAQRDDRYTEDELAWAAMYYAHPRAEAEDDFTTDEVGIIRDFWPDTWDRRWAQAEEDDTIMRLAKAGALIAAEIDRRLRIPTAPMSDV
jgi:hypothetical protein